MQFNFGPVNKSPDIDTFSSEAVHEDTGFLYSITYTGGEDLVIKDTAGREFPVDIESTLSLISALYAVFDASETLKQFNVLSTHIESNDTSASFLD